jgi:hypothetical protein
MQSGFSMLYANKKKLTQRDGSRRRQGTKALAHVGSTAPVVFPKGQQARQSIGSVAGRFC